MNNVKKNIDTACLGANEEIDAVRLSARQGVAHQAGRPRSVAGHLMRLILSALGDPAIQIILWDGETIATSPLPPVGRMTITDRLTLLKLFSHPMLRFGEAYSAGKITVDGDLTEFLVALYRAEQAARLRAASSRVLRQPHPVRSHSLVESRENIHRHYDIGNDFYALWLGATMAYTCAYFPTREATLDQAQVAKMHHVSRKLRLKPGDQVIEAGCGWGAQALLMARDYGVKVTAFNISRQQIEYARARAKALGLEGQVEYVEDDYRNISSGRGGRRFDAFVSIGMLEHVGVVNYPELGRLIRNCLKPSGIGLIHSIGRNRPLPLNPWIEKHIFPGAYTPSLAEMMGIFETADLSVLDVENLRLHYASTLRCWREAFEQSKERVASMFDATFVRMWRLYLAGSEAAFIAGDMQLFQVVCAPNTNNGIPWTRADLYGDRAPHAIL
jgi:cyclopropane-fatty-acyl-phospholipid synthase